MNRKLALLALSATLALFTQGLDAAAAIQVDPGADDQFREAVESCLRSFHEADDATQAFVQTLEESKNVHTIRRTPGNTSSETPTSAPDSKTPCLTNGTGKGTDTEVDWNPTNTSPFADGVARAPCASLMHELFHAYEDDQGLSNTKQSSTDVLIVEAHAVSVENGYRQNQGLPQRTRYGGKRLPPDSEVYQCDSTHACCGKTCTDTRKDSANCGGCGKACGKNEACANSKCDCAEGSKRCGTDCLDITSDSKNCGVCDHVCATGEKCAASQCVCEEGKTRCGSGEPCKDLSSDPIDCGECGVICQQGQDCVNGHCGCPGKDLTSDPNNCGRCGQECPSGQSCVDGECSCRNTNLDTDARNCGTCGHSCDTAGGETCVAGKCVCSGKDLMTDHSNCGKCGHACANGEVCVSGSCACGSNSNFQTDPNNCGSCGHQCPRLQLGQYACVAGVCTCTSGDYCDSVQGSGCCYNPSPFCNPCGSYTGLGCHEGGSICTSTPH